ncbi:MAX gene-associated protein-like [Salvelinus fontinalis]|uniref:MAX gene-associated protein-like n=1 Tax=Salvelinus fontinalis TaxID=8038 RepID=UPI0024858DFD|nr:MAX gene-associated protein-like [Salvelinus fontinalis]XP_055741365.1 MAX gene-associated protein-like [Salvelinus fontinalis]
MEDPTVMEESVEDSAITTSVTTSIPFDSVTMEPGLANEDGVEVQAVAMTDKDASLTSIAMTSSTDTITNTEVNLAMASSIHSDVNLAITLSTDAMEWNQASGTIAVPIDSGINSDAKPANPPIASASLSAAATVTNTGANPALPSPFSSSAASGPAPGGLQPEEGGLSAISSCGSVGVTLENSNVWREFHCCGTEMILTKQGRRMFPYCRYRLTGLEPTRRYCLVLSITPVDTYRHRWNLKEWEPSGPGEPHTQASCRLFPHQDSSALGKVWMASLVSFYKLKLTNHCLDQEGHVLLHSMHRYRPSLHVIPVADGDDLGFDPKLLDLQLLGPEVMTFTFPQTEFYAVTSYQNTRITQLKIDYNPFAKGFREDSGSPRLAKPRPEHPHAGKGDIRSPSRSSVRSNGGEGTEHIGTVNDVVADISMKKRSLPTTHPVGAEVSGKLRKVAPGTADSDANQTNVSASEEGIDLDYSDSDHVFHRQYLRAQLALPSGASRSENSPGAGGERLGAGMDPSIQASLTAIPQNTSQSTVLHTNSCSKPLKPSTVEPMESEVPPSQKVPLLEPTMTAPISLTETQEDKAASLTPKTSKPQKIAPKPSPTPSPLTPTASPFAVPKPWKKGRKPGGNRWGSVGKVSKGTKAATAAVTATSSPIPVAMQPELDDVEGLLFVSFTSKEALGVHVEDMPSNNTSPVTQEQPEKTVLESVEEKIAGLQTILLQDLNTLKYRQVIHPVLQEVGLKLSSLDPGLAIDLQYLGVRLPLSPPVFTGLGSATSTDGSRSFVSRTGKTSDLTKIKGWRDKFIRTKETSKNHNPNRSAFCSEMLDQYLESEAQRISDRAAAFSHKPLGSVAYQLPVTSTSYVRTLDSVLKTRAPPPPAFCRPCPLSRKPLLYAALKKPPPPINRTPPKAAKHKPTPAQGKQHHMTPAQGKARSSSVLRPIQVTNSNKTTAAKATAGVKVTSPPTAQRSPPGQGAVRRDSSPGRGLSSGLTGLSKKQLRLVGLSKIQLRMMEMEDATFYQGHDRTHITTERVERALMALLTAQGLPKSRAPQASPVDSPECGSEFCRLGCVCSSLARVSRGPLHCYRPDCMLGCSCFKRRITKQTTAAENGQHQTLPVYTVSNVEHEVQPNRGVCVSTLWDCASGVDPEPLFSPKPAPNIPIKPLTRIYNPGPKRYVPRLTPELREEDKDPVYKYFESMMTCARVREFNSQPPPQVLPPQVHLFKDNNSSIIPSSRKKIIAAILSPPNKPVVRVKSPSTQAKKPKVPEPTRQLEIQSECNWDQHRKLVLGVLCRRMTQNRLSEPFNIGPYHVRLLSNTHKRKAESTIIIFKVCISKAEDGDTDDSDESDSEVTDHSSDDSDEDEEEEGIPKPEEPEMQVGVTPFLTGVVPAGRLKARKKQPTCPAVGLIQVNGKSYSQARLLLGQMGALHPANRLAAFVTGRLRSVAKAPQKSLNCFPRTKKTPVGAGHLKTAATAVAPQGSSSIIAMAKKVALAQKVFQTPAGKNRLPPYRPPWSLGVTKSKGKTSTSQTTTNPKDPVGSPLLLVPMAPPPAPGTSQGSPPGVSPPGVSPPAGKMLLQTVSSSQGCKMYRQPNGQLIKLVPLNRMRHIKAKNQDKPTRFATKPSTPKTFPPPPPLTSIHPPPHAPLIKFIMGQLGAITPTQTSSSSSPLSLTVSSSLKTPSFLGQTGTYSFRICPPTAGDQGSRGPGQGTVGGPAGVSLPGGFTLIQLPKPGGTGGGAPRLPELIRTTAMGSAGPGEVKAQKNPRGTSSSSPLPLALTPVKTEDHSYTPGFNTNTSDSRSALAQKKQSLTQSKDLKSDCRSAKANTSCPVEPNELTCDEQMLSDESDAERGEVGEGSGLWSPESWKKDTEFSRFTTLRMHENGHPDVKVEDSDSENSTDDSSDDSDSDSDEYANEDEEEPVDIETVEERRQGITIAQMRAAVKHTQKTSQDGETAPKPKEKHQRDMREEEGSGSGEGGGRKNRTLTERLRRGEHQKLFTRLKQVLFMEELDPKVSKLHLLSQALKEIRTLSVDSESLEEKKRMLTEIQTVYVKEIAYMSGKPEELIKAKLKEIWEKKRTLAAQRRAAVPPTSSPTSSTSTPSPNTMTVSQVSQASSLGQAGAASGSVKPVAAVLRTKSGKIILPASMLRASKPAGRSVYTLKVMKRPTVTSLLTPTSSAAKEVVEKERAASGPEKDPGRVSGEAEQPSDSPPAERPELGKEEPQAPVCNGSMEEEISTEKDNSSTPKKKKSLINKNSIKRLSGMKCPLVEIAPLNSAIWRPLEEPQMGGESDAGGWGLSLTKGEAAILVKALSEHQGIIVGRKGKDRPVQHNGKKSSVTLKGKDSSELQKEQDSTVSQKEADRLVPQKGEDSSVTPKESDSSIIQKAEVGLVTSKEKDGLLTQKGEGGSTDSSEAQLLKRKRGRPRLDIKTPQTDIRTPPTGDITTNPAPRGRPRKVSRIGVNIPVVMTGGNDQANVTQTTGSASNPTLVTRIPPGRDTNTGGGEILLTPRERSISPTRRGRKPKVSQVGVTTSPVATTGPGGSPARVTQAGGRPVKSAAGSPATWGRPPKVRRAGDGSSPAKVTRDAVPSPVTRAGLNPARWTRAGGGIPVVKTEGSPTQPPRGGAEVTSPVATTKGSPGKTPQAVARPGTRHVTRAVSVKGLVSGKRTTRSDKA